MSRRRRIKQHRGKLAEIREIMEAMKNLAVLETHKLTSVLENQELLSGDLERIAAEFLAFHADWLPRHNSYTDVWLLFGSERGFCGDFNETLLERLDAGGDGAQGTGRCLIPVGQKLCSRLRDDPRVFAFVEGADVAEETTAVLTTLIRHISELQSRHQHINVFALYHHSDSDEPVSAQLLPPFRNVSREEAGTHPPVMHIEPEIFYLELVERYLFVMLQEITSNSLMSESHRRIQHMTGAINRLEETEESLMRQYHIQRQEEITEEIEVILLNAAAGPEQ